MTSCGIMIISVFVYLGDGGLVLRYMLLVSKHPNLAIGVYMTLFISIFVVSNTDVSVLFFYRILFFSSCSKSHYSRFVVLWTYICHKLCIFDFFCFGTSWFLIKLIEFIPLMRYFSFIDFLIPCIDIPYSLDPDVSQTFCLSDFLWFIRYLNSSIWLYSSSHTACA